MAVVESGTMRSRPGRSIRIAGTRSAVTITGISVVTLSRHRPRRSHSRRTRLRPSGAPALPGFRSPDRRTRALRLAIEPSNVKRARVPSSTSNRSGSSMVVGIQAGVRRRLQVNSNRQSLAGVEVEDRSRQEFATDATRVDCIPIRSTAAATDATAPDDRSRERHDRVRSDRGQLTRRIRQDAAANPISSALWMGQQLHRGNHDVPTRWRRAFHSQRGISERPGLPPHEHDEGWNASRGEDQNSSRRGASSGDKGNDDRDARNRCAGNAEQQIANEQPASHQPQIAQDSRPGVRLHAPPSPPPHDRQVRGARTARLSEAGARAPTTSAHRLVVDAANAIPAR